MRNLEHHIETQQHSGSNNFLVLRLLAATAVIVGHSFVLAPHHCADCMDPALAVGLPSATQTLGVDIFFVISGFLIFRSSQVHSIQQFIAARFFRIFPALAVCAVVMACAVGPLFTVMPLSEYFSSKDVPLYVGRAVAFARHPSFTLPGVTFSQGPQGISVNGSLWTIPLEIRLYALTAIVALAAKYTRMPPLVVMAGIGLLACYVDLSAIIPNEDAYRLSWLFASGAVLYIFRRLVPLHWSIAIAAFTAWICLSKSSLAMSAILLSYLTMYLAYLPRLATPDFIEDFSYGIYLYAFPIQQILSHAFPSIGPIRLMAMSVPLAWLAGWASWKLIERPAMTQKDRFLKKSIFQSHSR